MLQVSRALFLVMLQVSRAIFSRHNKGLAFMSWSYDQNIAGFVGLISRHNEGLAFMPLNREQNVAGKYGIDILISFLNSI